MQQPSSLWEFWAEWLLFPTDEPQMGWRYLHTFFLYTIYTSALTSDSSYQIPFNLSLISKLLCETPAKHLGWTGLGVMIVLLQAIWNCYCRAISMKIEGPWAVLLKIKWTKWGRTNKGNNKSRTKDRKRGSPKSVSESALPSCGCRCFLSSPWRWEQAQRKQRQL